MPMVKQPLTVEHALLGFLRRGPMYGYEIHQRLLASAEIGLVWTIKQSQLYAILGRLEEDGLISSSLEPQGLRPPRKILSLTAAGEAAFLGWVTSPVDHGRDFRLEFLAKLYFAREEGGNTAATLVSRQIQASARRRDELRRRAEAGAAERSYDWLVLRYRLGQIEAALGWLELCAEEDWSIS